MSNFFEELKRRKVFRVSGSYAVVAWIIMQIGEVTFPALHLPDWILTAVVVVLLIGFPIVAIVAWIFDRTPDGVVKTQPLSSIEAAPPTQVGDMTVKTDARPIYLKKRNIFLVLGVVAGIMIGQINLFGDGGEKLVNYTGDRIPVAIADFENNTEDASLNGLSGLLITSLEQSNYLSVLTRSRMFDLLKQIGKPNVDIVDEKIGMEICRRADIGALVLTSIQQFGDLYTIDLKILDVETNEYLYSTNVQAEGKKNIPGLIDEISKQTRISLAERAEEVEKNQVAIASLTTKNLEAYKYFNLGEKAFYKLDFKGAIKQYLIAMEEDSTFALAAYKLAYSYQWHFMSELHDKYIKKAVKYIESVPDKERLYIRAQSIKNFQSKIPVYEEIIDKYPNEKLAYFEIGDMLFHNTRANESIAYFEKSHELDPSFEFAIQHLRWAYVGVEDHEKNIELTAKSSAIYPDDPHHKYNELNAVLYAGKFNEYFGMVRAIEDKEVQLIDTDIAFGYGYYVSGDYGKAVDRLEKAKKNTRKHWSRDGLFLLQQLAASRADRSAFLTYSDKALGFYNKNANYNFYTQTLITRARVLAGIFNEKENANMILEEIENIFNDSTNDIAFADLSGVFKLHLIDAYRLVNNDIRQNELYNQAFGVLSDNNLENAKVFLDSKNYQKAISIYNNILKGADGYQNFIANFNIGIAYMGENNYGMALKHFDSLKDNYFSGFNSRPFYYPKAFLYSGLANLELKNYRLAKSNIETFLQIWEPAPESLKEKKMAREALKKIDKAVS